MADRGSYEVSGGDLVGMRFLRELMEAGKVTPVIGRPYPLREVPEAIRYLVEGHGGGGKIVITVERAD
jgi:NADPH:quinone reductase-like Zn-dependent oxidoreductase